MAEKVLPPRTAWTCIPESVPEFGRTSPYIAPSWAVLAALIADNTRPALSRGPELPQPSYRSLRECVCRPRPCRAERCLRAACTSRHRGSQEQDSLARDCRGYPPAQLSSRGSLQLRVEFQSIHYRPTLGRGSWQSGHAHVADKNTEASKRHARDRIAERYHVCLGFVSFDSVPMALTAFANS
jgi:hypothetical protein